MQNNWKKISGITLNYESVSFGCYGSLEGSGLIPNSLDFEFLDVLFISELPNFDSFEKAESKSDVNSLSWPSFD